MENINMEIVGKILNKNIMVTATKCEYFERCGDPTSITCLETAGDYYGIGRKCGKFRFYGG